MDRDTIREPRKIKVSIDDSKNDKTPLGLLGSAWANN